MSNLYYVQYFTDTLPVTYALDLRKLNFLQKQSAHHTSVINLLFSLTASEEFELLCKKYSVIQHLAHGRFRACVWQTFVCHLSSFQCSIFTVLHVFFMYIHCFKKNRTPETFYYNFTKIALISIKIGTHNLHMT